MKRRGLVAGFAPLTAAMIMLSAVTLGAQPRDIRWQSGAVTLTGTLHLPSGGGPFPVAIVVPGSGCLPLGHRFYQAHVKELRRLGLAVFAYDKRGCGRSEGSWRDVNLDGLAADLLAALPALAADQAVDRSRIGFWGLSQGGWVSLIAAGRSTEVHHVVLLSGPPLTPAEQAHEVIALGMRARGQSEQAIERAVALSRRTIDVYRTDTGWDAVRVALDSAASEPWFAASGLGLIPRDDGYWRWLASILDYDPIPALRALPQPILAVYGEHDRLVPGPRSRDIVAALAPSAAGLREAVLIEGAGHQLRPGPDTDWSAAYWNALKDWLRRRGIVP